MKSALVYLAVLMTGLSNMAMTLAAGPKGAQLRDGWYFIKNPSTGKYLQVSGANNANSAGNLVISSGTKDKGQKFKLTNIGDGLVTLTSALGNYNIDVANEKDTNGNNILLYNAYGGVAQQFMILKTGTKDLYTIGTRVSHFDKAVDIDGGRSADGTNVLQWTNEMKPNQMWSFEPAEDNKFDCWSEALGYPCCSSCQTAVSEDDDGKWGVEEGAWCGILPHCI